MNNIQMPSSYAALTVAEQQKVCGGSEFHDAVSNFFDSLHFGDFFYGGGLISFSVSFVPMLLFRMVGLGVQAGIALYNEVSNLLNQILRDGESAINALDGQRRAAQSAPQTNSVGSFPGLLK